MGQIRATSNGPAGSLRPCVPLRFLLLALVNGAGVACGTSAQTPGDGGVADGSEVPHDGSSGEATGLDAADATMTEPSDAMDGAAVDATSVTGDDAAADAPGLDGGPGSDGTSESGSGDAGATDGSPGSGEAGGPGADGASESGSGDAGAADGSPGHGEAGSCALPCPAGQKPCAFNRDFGTSPLTGVVCVSTSDPAYGCSATSCNPCSVAPASAVTCTAGACAVQACPSGLEDCDGIASNGCETDLNLSQSCGSCGHACPSGQVCEQQMCVASCTFPRTNCSGSCRDLTSDPMACGSCTNKCPTQIGGTPTCTSSTCSASCDANASLCSGTCKIQDFVAPYCGAASGCGAGCGTSCTDPAGGGFAVCAAGQWTSQCFVGYSRCGGTCVDERSDVANCGACSVACGTGQTCVNGSCTAISTVQIVTGLTSPEDIAVDSTNFYFTDTGSNTVWQVNKSTLSRTRLGGTNEAKPWRLAVDGASVYWTSNQGGAIRTAPIGGGPGQTLYAANQPTAIAVDDAYVYWSDGGTGKIYKAPKNPDAGAPTVLASTTADEFKIDASSLFGWTSQFPGPVVYGLDKVSGALTSYAFIPGANGTSAAGIAINSQSVFYFWFSAFSGAGLWAVVDAPKSGSSSAPRLADNLSRWAYLAADDCAVYWTGGAGIWSATTAGGGSRLLTSAAVASHRIAVDDAQIYWTDQTWIGRIPK